MRDQSLTGAVSCAHGSSVTDDVAGELVCSGCGQVLAQNTVDRSSDSFVDDLRSMRTGPRISATMHDGGLSTVIGKANYDSKGNPVASRMAGTVNRMRIWDSRSRIRSTSNRNLVFALIEINKLREKMSLSDAIAERSAYFYRKAVEKKLVRGRSVNGIVGACVYAACREFGATRTITEIAGQMQEKRSAVARNYRLLFRRLSLDVSPADPLSGVIKFSNNLGLPERIKRDAILVLDALRESGAVAGKKPDAVSAAAIYMACVRNRRSMSQQSVARASHVTEVTIRARVREFKRFVPPVLPSPRRPR